MDNKFSQFSAEINSARASITKIDKIAGTEERDEAEAMRRSAAAIIVKIEIHRKTITLPLDKLKKAIMAEEKLLVIDLKHSLDNLTMLLTNYYDRAIEINERAEQEAEATYKASVASATTLEESISAETEHSLEGLRIAENKKGYREVTDWVITDITKIPLAYLMPDAAKIKKAVAEGIEIAGVEVTKKAIRTGK